MVRCGSKNRFRKEMYKKEIGVRAQKLLTNLGSIVNIIPGHLWDHLVCSRNKRFIRAPKIMRKPATATIWICQSSRTNAVVHVPREVGAELKVFV